MARLRQGAEAEVAASALPGAVLRGRISYSDPRVDAVTRTAKCAWNSRIPEKAFGSGCASPGASPWEEGVPRRLLPGSAIQPLGEASVVYLPAAEGEGRFVERAVTLGGVVGDAVQVLRGLKPGDRVVTEGSFFLRAEAARLWSGG